MTVEENKAVVRRYFEEFIGKGKLAVADEVLGSDVDHVAHGAPPGTPLGPEGAKKRLPLFRKAFPDFRITIEDLVAEGDKVATRLTFRGTHKGEFQGIPATNRPVTFSWFLIDRIADGKIVERLGLFDRMGLMQQLGVVPKQGRK